MAAPKPVFFSSESASVKALRRAVRSTRVRFPSGASRPRSYRTPHASSPSRTPSRPPPLVPSSQPLVLPRVSLEFARAGNKTRRQSNCPHENKKELTMAAENSRSSTRLRSTDALTSSSMRAKSALFFASASSRSASARVDSYFSRSSAASVRRSISAYPKKSRCDPRTSRDRESTVDPRSPYRDRGCSGRSGSRRTTNPTRLSG